ncbi:hypothetical protein GS597_09040 [Synechococcales cyanobacterium C]|uniref:Uncharacterized protein n=1 Tax=Petrachloros mirabilis ULC683 TaxID=2781853 RepID=A0A8K1ZZE8_9CYAN|nr:helix-turn-helix domain-containing protein [Petrachloros mirabilis]NCJ06647.1 hypothetical protein [Petrachloros mirabilis ULC683]
MKQSIWRHLVWCNLRRARQSLTAADLAKGVLIQRASVYLYCSQLARAGYLAVEEGGPCDPYAYRLIRDTGPAAPMANDLTGEIYDPNLTGPIRSAKQRCWNAIRVFGGFEAHDIARAGEIEPPCVYRYLKQLERQGYVNAIRAGRRKIYRLCRNTGPLAPFAEGGRLYDPNLNCFLEDTDEE